MLEKYGMTEKDITLIHMEMADAVTAFVANQGDFASSARPSGRRSWTNLMMLRSSHREGSGSSDGKALKTKMVEVTASKAFADQNPEAVTKFVDVLYNRTHKYFNDPPLNRQLTRSCRPG